MDSADTSPASTAPEKYNPEAGEPDPQDEELWDALYTEASALISFAADFDLKVLGLQPLNQFDGWMEGERADWVRAKAKRWLMLCEKLEVQFLQVSGSFGHVEWRVGLSIAQADSRSEATTTPRPTLPTRSAPPTFAGWLSSGRNTTSRSRTRCGASARTCMSGSTAGR